MRIFNVRIKVSEPLAGEPRYMERDAEIMGVLADLSVRLHVPWTVVIGKLRAGPVASPLGKELYTMEEIKGEG